MRIGVSRAVEVVAWLSFAFALFVACFMYLNRISCSSEDSCDCTLQSILLS